LSSFLRQSADARLLRDPKQLVDAFERELDALEAAV
jgi:hypothetical protein